MADRTSAEIFGRLFEMLAKDLKRQKPAVKEERAKIADALMDMSQDYDFDLCQMEADDALETLGYPQTEDDE